MPLENLVTEPVVPGKRSVTYLELLDDELCTHSLEGGTNKNCHVLALVSFPESYMLLISVSSTPISFCRYSVVASDG